MQLQTIADFSQRCDNNAHGKPQNTFLGLFTTNDYRDLRIIGFVVVVPSARDLPRRVAGVNGASRRRAAMAQAPPLTPPTRRARRPGQGNRQEQGSIDPFARVPKITNTPRAPRVPALRVMSGQSRSLQSTSPGTRRSAFLLVRVMSHPRSSKLGLICDHRMCALSLSFTDQ